MPPIDPILLRSLGILGSVLIVVGYALKDRPFKRATAIINLVGALTFGITLIYRNSIEGLVLQFVWALISIKDFRNASRRSDQETRPKS
jgi:fluoride ion exporter CrcB/FEX